MAGGGARYRGPGGRERSKTFDRRVDADRWLAGVSFAIARGEWTDPARSRVTVGDWSRQWLTAKAPSLKATTRESHRSILKTCIWPTWEQVPLAAVTHSDVAAWVTRLSAQMGAPQGVGSRRSFLSGPCRQLCVINEFQVTLVTAFHSPGFLIIASVS